MAHTVASLVLFHRSPAKLRERVDLRHFVDSLEYSSIDTPVLFRLSCILRFYSKSCTTSPTFSVAKCNDLWCLVDISLVISWMDPWLMKSLQVRWKLTMRFSLSLSLSVRRRGRLKLILCIISPLTLCNHTLLILRKLTLVLRKCWVTKMSLLILCLV